MKIVNIIGGLGNQMFQCAFALSLKEKYPLEDVYVDISHFRHLFIKKWGSANLHNGFEINKLYPNFDLQVATPWNLFRVSWYIPNYFLSRFLRRYLPKRASEVIQKPSDYFIYDSSVYEKNGDTYFEGQWESISYYLPIRERLMQVFAHPTPNMINSYYIQQMEHKESVGLHVRRGDYLASKGFCGVCDLNYYKRAIELLLSEDLEYTFYVFSDDPKWCENNIRPLVGNNDFIMVTENTGENSCWDMFLMTHCRYLIIANSSFSWWGAFLNNNVKKVIAPQKWINRNTEFDIWDPDWIRV